MDGEKEIQKIVFDSKLHGFIDGSLRQSLSSIGYSRELLDELFIAIKNLDTKSYIQRHGDELHQLHGVHFLNDLAGEYFSTYIVPEVLRGKVLDLGCGTGTLLKALSKKTGIEAVGIDVNSYPEWNLLREKGIRVEEVLEKDFAAFIKKELPDAVVMTWVLHHMDYAEQERYLKTIYDVLKLDSEVVVLEDAYSEKLPPEKGKHLYEDFMVLSIEDRKKVMGVFDWIANRVLEQREKIPMPFGYRTLEEWAALFQKIGFKIVKERFIGFPENRDVNNGQSVLAAVK